MVPNQAPPTTTTVTAIHPPNKQPPSYIRSSTAPTGSLGHTAPNRTLLAPEDAIYQGSPPRKQSPAVKKLQNDLRMTAGLGGGAPVLPRGRNKTRNRSSSRKRKVSWSKLLWVKQSCKSSQIQRTNIC